MSELSLRGVANLAVTAIAGVVALGVVMLLVMFQVIESARRSAETVEKQLATARENNDAATKNLATSKNQIQVSENVLAAARLAFEPNGKGLRATNRERD